MADIKIGKMVLGSCATNCYFLYEAGKTQAIVVDPADNGEQIYQKLTDNGFEIAAILLTHGHFDHIIMVILTITIMVILTITIILIMVILTYL